jgi:formimidoylglutamate deiminase
MLEFGFTSVCEFHYVHHQSGGDSYDNPAEMSDRLIAAADRTGLGLTLLPVLYAHGGIGKPPEEAQRRFVHGMDEYLALLDTLRDRRDTRAKLCVGAALHSLRAVAPDEVHAALVAVNAIDPVARVHIHVSETTQEVTEVEAALGARPVQWLLDNTGLDDRWCLVHATHLDATELAGTAASGAVAGLCPVTEANSLPEYHAANGRWGVGTDSQCSTSIAAELRMLEYGKRLELKRRNVIARPADGPGAHSGRVLFDSALAGDDQASGQGGGALVPGRRADLVMLDGDRNVLLGHGPQTALDAWILGSTQNPVRDVMVAGKWIICDGQHPEEAAIRATYRDCPSAEKHGPLIYVRVPQGLRRALTRRDPMRLTVYTDYALRLLMYLALKDDGLATIEEIADSYGISKNHLMKVTHQLGVGGYIETVRGRRGGLRLAKPAEEIGLGDVVRYTEPDFAIVMCLEPIDADCAVLPRCVLRRALERARDAFMKVLDEYTLGDLVKPRAALRDLLAIAPHADAGR